MTELEIAMISFYVLEKVVKITPCKWDDILIDGLKSIFIKKK